jgi:diadenylate cyclase
MFHLEFILLALRFRYVKNLWNSIVDFFNQVRGLFKTINLIDVVDILFVAIMIYIIIRIIRETRAMQLLKGLGLFILLYFAVSFFGMNASSYLMRAIFSNILIIVVILFGPELRNILEQLGSGAARSRILSILNLGAAVELTEVTKTIDATCKACANMSDDKIGALIVFEKQTMLGDIISSGTLLEAKASRELIENVFFPKSPLHDGAMIIRNGKVTAAGCILPLTANNSLASSFGTRHRAAVGLTEQSDAIVVVVSEETGNISVAMNGALTHDVSTGELRDILTNQFIPTSQASDETGIKKLIRRIKK